MSYGKPKPVKLTDEQEKQLADLQEGTGYDASKILRAAMSYFLEESKTMSREELLKLLSAQAVRERTSSAPTPKSMTKAERQRIIAETREAAKPGLEELKRREEKTESAPTDSPSGKRSK